MTTSSLQVRGSYYSLAPNISQTSCRFRNPSSSARLGRSIPWATFPSESNTQLDYRHRSPLACQMYPQKPSVQQMYAVSWMEHEWVVLRVLVLVFVFEIYLAEGLIDSVET